MKNVTISLPDEVAHAAKVFAAEQNTSVSKFVGGLLRERLEAEGGYQAALKRWRRRKPMVIHEAKTPYPSRSSVYER